MYVYNFNFNIRKWFASTAAIISGIGQTFFNHSVIVHDHKFLFKRLADGLKYMGCNM